MTPDLYPLVQRVKELDEKATPGPWTFRDVTGAGLQFYGDVPSMPCVDLPKGMPDQVMLGGMTQPQNVMLGYERWVQFEPKGWRDMQVANMAFITEARTLLPQLASALAASQRETQELREQRDTYRTNGIREEERANALLKELETSRRETQELNAENEKLSADWHQASMQACRDNETIMRLRRVLIGEGIDALLVSSDEMPAIVEKLRRETQEAREIARRNAKCSCGAGLSAIRQSIPMLVRILGHETSCDLSTVASWPLGTGESK